MLGETQNKKKRKEIKESSSSFQIKMNQPNTGHFKIRSQQVLVVGFAVKAHSVANHLPWSLTTAIRICKNYSPRNCCIVSCGGTRASFTNQYKFYLFYNNLYKLQLTKYLCRYDRSRRLHGHIVETSQSTQRRLGFINKLLVINLSKTSLINSGRIFLIRKQPRSWKLCARAIL